jgi:hypothetical protein
MPGNPYRDPESQLCEGASDRIRDAAKRTAEGIIQMDRQSPPAGTSTSPVVKCLAAVADEGGVPPRKRKL